MRAKPRRANGRSARRAETRPQIHPELSKLSGAYVIMMALLSSARLRRSRVTSRLKCKFRVLCSMLMLVASSSGSVQHFDIPGNVPITRTGEAEAVVADLYVKVVQDGASRQYRGVAFFASVDATRYHTWCVQLQLQYIS